MTFDYLQRVIVDGQLDVENIGQCTIQANSDLGEEYYLIIRTSLGFTELLEYGPCVPDFLPQLQANYQINYSRIEYNQGKIERAIDRFLNNPKRMITQAKIIELEDIREFLVNPVDFMMANGEDNFEDE